MNATPLSNDMALRIGLAARELPDIDAAGLLRALKDIVGLPPTEKKLSSLKLKDLKTASNGEFSAIDASALKSALSYLTGEAGISSEPLPEVVTYNEGDMPNSIRVACASNSAAKLDGHFGSCQRFLIYQVSESENRLIELREIDNSNTIEDKNAYRAALIKDCQLLFVASIGGPAAAKVVRFGVHPIKKPMAESAIDEIQALQAVIAKDAPPWLAKVMGQSPEQRIRFEQESEE